MDDNQSEGSRRNAQIRQSKLMIMQLQLDIYKGVPGKKASIKVKRSMKLLLKVMVVLYKGLPHPKGEMSSWEPNAIHDLTRVPMYGKYLPFTQHHF